MLVREGCRRLQGPSKETKLGSCFNEIDIVVETTQVDRPSRWETTGGLFDVEDGDYLSRLCWEGNWRILAFA